MRTFVTFFGTGFAVSLLAATAQAGGGRAVTPPSVGLVTGLSPALSSILKRFYDCIAALSAGHTPPGSRPGDPNDCKPEWVDSFEGLVYEGKTAAVANLTLNQITVEAGGYAMRDQVLKYGVGEGFYDKAIRDARERIH